MAEKRPDERVRQALEGAREKMISKFGEHKSRVIIRSCLAALVILIVAVAAILLIKVRSVEIKGDVTMFNESEIAEAAGINVGDRLFSKSAGRIKRNIQENIPLAQKVKVRKSIFGKVTITVSVESVDYYIKSGEYYYALDCELKVLDKSNTASKYSEYGAVFVKLPKIREPKVGEKIVFYDTVEEKNSNGELLYKVREESFYDYVTSFLTRLRLSSYHEKANGVILEEKFDVTLIYDEKYKIVFGNVSNLDVKFSVLGKIIAEGSLDYAEKVSIDVSEPSRATARADLTLDFSEFVN